jgi:hypothetical protein
MVWADPLGPWGLLLGRIINVLGLELFVDMKGEGYSASVYSLPL